MTDKPTVIAALSQVMADVQAISKDGRNEQQRYLFRGIDAVMNAVGPALRRHGVVIVPEHVETHYRDAQTTSGKATREVTVVVTYRAYGPAGDSVTMQAPGESLDSGDKGTAKAMSDMLKKAFKKNFFTKLSYLFVKGGLHDMKDKMNPKTTGGALLIGVNAVVVKAHGNSDGEAFYHAIELADKLAKAGLVKKIAEGVENG